MKINSVSIYCESLKKPKRCRTPNFGLDRLDRGSKIGWTNEWLWAMDLGSCRGEASLFFKENRTLVGVSLLSLIGAMEEPSFGSATPEALVGCKRE